MQNCRSFQGLISVKFKDNFLAELLQINRCKWMETIFRFLLTDICCNFLLETNLQQKSGRNVKKRFYSSFLKHFATVLQRFQNGTETVLAPVAAKRFRNGTETVHLQ
jgi:hypothetical protein